MADYKKVVEMLGENLASLLELAKKWFIIWEMNTKKVIHILSHFKKADLQGLIDETHHIIPKIENNQFPWVEKDEIITLSPFTTDGTTGEEWITRLKNAGCTATSWAEQLLRSNNFIPTTGVVRNIKILKGEIFSDSNRVTKNIQEKATQFSFEQVTMEDICWLRLLLSNDQLEKMGLSSIIGMHESVEGLDGDLSLLGVTRLDGHSLYAFCNRLGAYDGSSGSQWRLGRGFAFHE